MKNFSLEIIRHSTSHLMAAAVLELFPKAKFGIGPVIENGFYYDFDLEQRLTPQDLPKIENKMRQLVKKNIKFEKKEIGIDEAEKLFGKNGQPYKVELIHDLKKYGTTEEISKYENTNKPQNKVTHISVGKFH